MPNSFKLPFVSHQFPTNSFSEDEKVPLFHNKILSAFESSTDTKYSAFFFFQNNLTAEVQAFRGPQSHNSKDDEGSWTRLVEEDFSFVENAKGKKIFCRLVLHDEYLKQEINLPILDKYFLLDKTTSLQFPRVEEVVREFKIPRPPEPQDARAPEVEKRITFRPGGDLGNDVTFWESKNQEKLRQIQTVTEKGIMTDGGGPRVMPMPEIHGPDPSPTGGLDDDMPTGGIPGLPGGNGGIAGPQLGPEGPSGGMAPGAGPDVGPTATGDLQAPSVVIADPTSGGSYNN